MLDEPCRGDLIAIYVIHALFCRAWQAFQSRFDGQITVYVMDFDGFEVLEFAV